jgi:hypothetical protein
MISLVDCTDEEWNYKVMYQDKFWFVDSLIPFEEMSALERERFTMNAFVPAFNHFREKALDQRPQDVIEEELGITAADYEEEDEENTGVGQYIVDKLEELASRLEDIEIRLNKKPNDPPTK